jgi:hypothetical protein
LAVLAIPCVSMHFEPAKTTLHVFDSQEKQLVLIYYNIFSTSDALLRNLEKLPNIQSVIHP